MPISFRCPSCRHKFRVRRKYVGKRSTCPFCQKEIRIRWNEKHRPTPVHVSEPEQIQALESLAAWEYDADVEAPAFRTPDKPRRQPAPIYHIVFGIAIALALGGGLAWVALAPEKPSVSHDELPDALEKPMAGVLDLLALYHASQEVADSQYKGKLLTVMGVVDKIDKQSPHGLYLTFVSGKEFSQLVVQCRFDPKNAGELDKVREGQRIGVAGTCMGFDQAEKAEAPATSGKVDRRKKVLLKDCVLSPELEGSGQRE